MLIRFVRELQETNVNVNGFCLASNLFLLSKTLTDAIDGRYLMDNQEQYSKFTMK